MSDESTPAPDSEWHNDPAWTGEKWQVVWNGPDRVTLIVGTLESRTRRTANLSNDEARQVARCLLAATSEERP